MGKTTYVRWWLCGGTETCYCCLQKYHCEMEYRCVFCDRSVCPMCVDLEYGGEPLCPECMNLREE